MTATTPGDFDRDTVVRRRGVATGDATASEGGGGVRETTVFDADVAPGWRAGRGPHGGYLAAMMLRALVETVADPARAPRSLTIHYARAPQPGPVQIAVTLERAGRSLSTLSARMEQNGELQALALAAFSVPWRAPEIAELPLPDVAAPDPDHAPVQRLHPAMPRFLRNLILQPRIGGMPFSGSTAPMEVGAWLGLPGPRPLDAPGLRTPDAPEPQAPDAPEPQALDLPGLRPLDAPALALFSDALFSPPFVRLPEPAVTPTIDLTIHFRQSPVDGLSLAPESGREELCFARFRSTVVHDGFFEEDGVIWAADGTVLAQSRQLAIVLPFDPSP